MDDIQFTLQRPIDSSHERFAVGDKNSAERLWLNENKINLKNQQARKKIQKNDEKNNGPLFLF